MSLPSIKPCPNCKTSDNMGIATYDSGWRYIECDKCLYRGPGEGSKRQAILAHNQTIGKAESCK